MSPSSLPVNVAVVKSTTILYCVPKFFPPTVTSSVASIPVAPAVVTLMDEILPGISFVVKVNSVAGFFYFQIVAPWFHQNQNSLHQFLDSM